MSIEEHPWYQNIEPKIRELVFRLRNAGINTECSCGHGMWIQCQSLDQYSELRTIYNVMIEMAILDYQAVVHDEVNNGCRHTFIEIMLPDHNGQYHQLTADNPMCLFNMQDEDSSENSPDSA